MMVHVVVYRPRADVGEDQVARVQHALEVEMGAAYPGIESVSGGRTFTERGAGYTHGMVWRWRDRESWQRQVGDAPHVEIATRHFSPLRDAFLALDFEVVT